AFPVKDDAFKNRESSVDLPKDIIDISDNFSFNFHTAGIMRDDKVYTAQPITFEEDNFTPLKDILLSEEEVDDKYYLKKELEEKFDYLRGAKKIKRVSASGHEYTFSEGSMSPTDDINKPGRTMLTSEGTTNRSSHIVNINGRKRFLTPIECERLNGFPDNWTDNMSDRMRYFCMGNALVVDLITIMGKRIEEIEKHETSTTIQIELLSN